MIDSEKVLFRPIKHTDCENCGLTYSVEELRFKQGKTYKRELDSPEIIFVRRGKIVLCGGTFGDIEVEKGYFFLHPSGVEYSIYCLENTILFSCCLCEGIVLCENYSFASLDKHAATDSKKFVLLETKPVIENCLDIFMRFFTQGLVCKHYLYIKIKELLYYIHVLYTKEELASFFAPIFDQDTLFKENILACMRKDIGSQELYQRFNMSRSSFDQRFKRVMGDAPKRYVSKYKADLIRQDLLRSPKLLKELAADYGFNSENQFIRFCKSNIGCPPRKLKKKKGNSSYN